MLWILFVISQSLVLATRRNTDTPFHQQFGEAIKNKDKDALLRQYPVL